MGRGHRPSSKQCHHNGKKPTSHAVSKMEKQTYSRSSVSLVLVAPIMGKKAFEFAGQFGPLVETVKGCARQGVIVPLSRIKQFLCNGGGLQKVRRSVDQSHQRDEKITPHVAIYDIFSDGTGGKGHAYRMQGHLTEKKSSQV